MPDLLDVLDDMRDHTTNPYYEKVFIAAYDEITKLNARVKELQEQRDSQYWDFLSMRGVEKGDVCPACGGLGVRAYPSTSTWRGGIGGQKITNDICDECWGSGRASVKWTDLRELAAAKK